jgi:uncharacterized protein YlzI (FlbEa/FlbD family)
MINFVKLTHNGETVYISVKEIIMVMKNTDGQTYLRLTHGHGVVVSESIEEAMGQIYVVRNH